MNSRAQEENFSELHFTIFRIQRGPSVGFGVSVTCLCQTKMLEVLLCLCLVVYLLPTLCLVGVVGGTACAMLLPYIAAVVVAMVMMF